MTASPITHILITLTFCVIPSAVSNIVDKLSALGWTVKPRPDQWHVRLELQSPLLHNHAAIQAIHGALLQIYKLNLSEQSRHILATVEDRFAVEVVLHPSTTSEQLKQLIIQYVVFEEAFDCIVPRSRRGDSGFASSNREYLIRHIDGLPQDPAERDQCLIDILQQSQTWQQAAEMAGCRRLNAKLGLAEYSNEDTGKATALKKKFGMGKGSHRDGEETRVHLKFAQHSGTFDSEKILSWVELVRTFAGLVLDVKGSNTMVKGWNPEQKLEYMLQKVVLNPHLERYYVGRLRAFQQQDGGIQTGFPLPQPHVHPVSQLSPHPAPQVPTHPSPQPATHPNQPTYYTQPNYPTQQPNHSTQQPNYPNQQLNYPTARPPLPTPPMTAPAVPGLSSQSGPAAPTTSSVSAMARQFESLSPSGPAATGSSSGSLSTGASPDARSQPLKRLKTIVTVVRVATRGNGSQHSGAPTAHLPTELPNSIAVPPDAEDPVAGPAADHSALAIPPRRPRAHSMFQPGHSAPVSSFLDIDAPPSSEAPPPYELMAPPIQQPVQPVQSSDFQFYFAFGSNMDEQQMHLRSIQILQRLPAAIPNFRLTFNKLAQKSPGVGYANIVPAEPGSPTAVYGVLYLLAHPHHAIQLLDRYEGVAGGHYTREVLPVQVPVAMEGMTAPRWVHGYGFDQCHTVKAVMYIAGHGHVREGLLPTRVYKERLLKGGDLLPPDYVEALRRVPTLESSNM
ncbi:hypothetical protein HDV00_002957 [Rhizophlyctis rosea]|nr:hypothetical protein HDV00_002957 [Rhizophlyctis rosea]